MPTFRFSFNSEYTYFDEELGGIRPKPEVFNEELFERKTVGDDLIEFVCKATGNVVARCEIVESEAKGNLLKSMGY